MAVDFSDAETMLMDAIRKRHGALIVEQCKSSSVRPEFLAALIANESGGHEDAVRFEPTVFGRLLEVCASKRAAYQPAGIKAPLGAQDLLGFIEALGTGFLSGLHSVTGLATSHGLTQIMGWHCIEFAKDFGILGTPNGQIRFTIDLLSWFAQNYSLALGTDDEGLLRCWNTGRPDGQTYDPQYVAKALRRMKLYLAVVDAAAAGETIH